MAPRRFVPVRRSQSLFEELWERPLIRRRRSRFGRSLALAGTQCQDHNDEIGWLQFDEFSSQIDGYQLQRAPKGSAHSAVLKKLLDLWSRLVCNIPEIVLSSGRRACFEIMMYLC